MWVDVCVRMGKGRGEGRRLVWTTGNHMTAIDSESIANKLGQVQMQLSEDHIKTHEQREREKNVKVQRVQSRTVASRNHYDDFFKGSSTNRMSKVTAAKAENL